MAGGIDWFRWHHGSVTDPKFKLVARKSGARLGDVIAVWAYLLETASAASERGHYGGLDCEAVDCLLGCDDGTTAAILSAMEDRDLLDDGKVCAWEKRQPKREDETANDRKRRQREREHELRISGRVTTSESRDVTQGHADVTQGHARGEERREEEIQLLPTVVVGGAARCSAPSTSPPDFDGENAEVLNGKSIVRIAPAWELPEEWGKDAEALGFAPPVVLREAEKFRQYWVAGKGAGTRRSVKGWRQTWSNWLEKAAKDAR